MKHVSLRGTYVIRAPREKVYAVITDFEKAPEYFPSVAKSARWERTVIGKMRQVLEK